MYSVLKTTFCKTLDAWKTDKKNETVYLNQQGIRTDDDKI